MSGTISEKSNDEVKSESIDDQIDRWHRGEGGDLPLHVFLGMSWSQYKAWVEQRKVDA